MPIEERDTRLPAFLVALFDTGSPLGVVIGSGLGYFALRLFAAAQKALESRGR
jgi:hypothetical protein